MFFMLTAVIVIAYFAIMLGYGVYFAKRNKDIKSYSIASQTLPLYVTIPLVATGIVGAGSTAGLVAGAFRNGMSASFILLGVPIGVLLMYLLGIMKVYRALSIKKGIMTVPQVMRFRYGQVAYLTHAVLSFCVLFMILGATAPSSAGIIAPMLNIDYQLAAWLIIAVLLLQVLLGGMRSIGWISILQGILLFCGTFWVMFKALSAVGGFEGLSASINPAFFQFDRPTFQISLAILMGAIFAQIVNSFSITSIFSAKSAKAAYWGMGIGSAVLIPLGLGLAIVGICAAVLVPQSAPNSAVYNVATLFGTGYGAAISIAILAAVFSTSMPGYLYISTLFVRDIYLGLFKLKADDKKQFWIARIMLVIVCISSTWIGLYAPSIISLVSGAQQIATSYVIVFIMGFLWKRTNEIGAVGTIAFGGGGGLLWYILGKPWGIEPVWVVWAIGIPIILICGLLSKNKVDPGYTAVKEILDEYDRDVIETGKS